MFDNQRPGVLFYVFAQCLKCLQDGVLVARVFSTIFLSPPNVRINAGHIPDAALGRTPKTRHQRLPRGRLTPLMAARWKVAEPVVVGSCHVLASFIMRPSPLGLVLVHPGDDVLCGAL